MTRDSDNVLAKRKIIDDVLKEYKHVDPRFYLYENQEEMRLTIARNDIPKTITSEDEIREKVERRLEVDYCRLIGAQYFSNAAEECINAYQHGLFIACVMMTHPVNEGIIKFIVERNQIKQTGDLPDVLSDLESQKLISRDCVQASEAIWRSYRNDIHHMNKGITKVKDWHELARQNLRHLATIERYVFGYDLDPVKYCLYGYKGLDEAIAFIHHPKYWDIKKTNDGYELPGGRSYTLNQADIYAYQDNLHTYERDVKLGKLIY